MELDAFFNLLFDAFLGLAIGRVESGITAKSATTRADFAIPVRTAEACIDADFLHTPAKLLREVAAVAVESPLVAPWE